MRNFIVCKNPPIQLTVRANNTTLRVDKNTQPAMESMRNVVLSVGKKPVLSTSLVLDLLTFVTSFVMAVYLLASLPAPFPQSYVKVARDRVDAMWWTLLAGGIILLFYRRVDLHFLFKNFV